MRPPASHKSLRSKFDRCASEDRAAFGRYGMVLASDKPSVAVTSRQGIIRERRQITVDAPTEAVFRAFSSLGGRTGWLYMNWAWKLRGAVDRLFGGVGMRKGRRDPEIVRVGETIDFWLVVAVEPGHLLRLRAEMKVPGQAWLQFEVRRDKGDFHSRLTQTTYFAPRGILGLLYWYTFYPLHALIFVGMIRKLATRAKSLSKRSSMD